jgi:hypothetical protein
VAVPGPDVACLSICLAKAVSWLVTSGIVACFTRLYRIGRPGDTIPLGGDRTAPLIAEHHASVRRGAR